MLDAGSLKVTGLELAATLTPAPSSELVVSMETLGHLQLQGGATRLGAAAVDRWRLSTLRAVPMVARADGARTVAVGSLTFVGAAVVGGDTITTMAHNTTEVVLWPKGGSWHIEPFTVVYTAATGDAWTLQTSDLDFLAH